MTQMMGGDAPIGAQMTLAPTSATVPFGAASLVTENLTAGAVDSTTLNLAPGQYELIGNLKNH